MLICSCPACAAAQGGECFFAADTDRVLGTAAAGAIAPLSSTTFAEAAAVAVQGAPFRDNNGPTNLAHSHADQASDATVIDLSIFAPVYEPVRGNAAFDFAQSPAIDTRAGLSFAGEVVIDNVALAASAQPGATIVVMSAGLDGQVISQLAQVTSPASDAILTPSAEHAAPALHVTADVVVTLSVAVEVVTLQPPGIAQGEFAVSLGVQHSDEATASDVQLFAQADTSLIRLDLFRSDIRFAGIDGSGVSVVVIDSGIDLNHSFFGPDADGNGIADRIVYSYDFSGGNDGNASDTDGHGSHVASSVGSQHGTYTGMAPGVNIIALKVFPDGNDTLASTSDIAEALNWVVANRAAYNIVAVNMSLGYGDNLNFQQSSPFASQFSNLASNNVVNVVASGNSYISYDPAQGVSTPSNDPNAWSVGAVWDRDAGGPYRWSSNAIDYTTGADRIVSFSQRSTTMTTVFAPGGAIMGAYWDGGTASFSGTSMAAPHIAGLVADMQELSLQISGRLMSVNDLKTTMQSTAVTIYDGDDEHDNVFDSNAYYKRVDAYAWGVAVLDKLFAGTTGNDTLNGTAAADTIFGQAGNDQFNGRAGNDIIDGGAGTDTAIFSGLRSAYTLTRLGPGAVVVSGIDGTDTLSRVERLVFSDQTVIWPSPGAMAVTSAVAVGGVVELGDGVGGEGVDNRSTTGTVAFSDSNLTNAHVVSSRLASGDPSYAAPFAIQVTNDLTGDGTGIVTWTYTIND